MFYKIGEPHGLPHDPFKSCIAPRPIGWVSSLSATGVVNLAPFSFFNGLASDPPLVMIAINGYQPHGGEKDTLMNIEATKEFVVNMVPYALMEQMNTSCAPVAPEVNEMELAGLTPFPSELIAPPRVAESPIHLECIYERTVELPCTIENSRNAMVIGEVIGIHIADEVLTDGMVDTAKIRPISRLGYMEYAVVNEVFSMNRPKK
ncbi:MAG: flavin reductase family protein [Rhodospirillales bacterium]|nr:flavin reductase family protein [Rhodospirillales bacterium]